MEKYIVGELLKQGDACIILDGVVHKLETEWCKCPPKYKDCVGEKKVCYNCELPIKPQGSIFGGAVVGLGAKPKRELPEKMEVINEDDVVYRVLAKKYNEIIEYLK